MLAKTRPQKSGQKSKYQAPRLRRVDTQQSERFARLRKQPVEFIPSAEFDDLARSDEILRPWVAEADETGHQNVPAADTPPYLAALYSIPLLTKAQEFHLFRQMNYHKYLASEVQKRLQKRGSAKGADDMERHLAAAESLRNDIVQANLRLVVSIAKTVVDQANTLEDLISEGNVPLIRAVEIFDFTRGLRFSTYATWAVRNCLFRSSPKNRKRQQRFVTGVSEALAQSQDESEAMGGSERHWQEMQLAVSNMLDDLGPRERSIVAARFGLEDEPRSLKFHEIAGRLDLSTERVRQLLTRALGRLRTTADERLGDVA